MYTHLRKIVYLKKGGQIPKYLPGGSIDQKKQQAIQNFRQNHANELTGFENDDTILNMLMSQQINDEETLDGRVNAADFTQSVLDENGVTLEQANDKVAELKERGVIQEPK